MCVKNSKSTLFWKDIWLYNDPLYTLSPDLFKICDQKDISVFQLVSGLVPISFCRWLTPGLRTEWDKIMEDVLETQLVSEYVQLCGNLRVEVNFL